MSAAAYGKLVANPFDATPVGLPDDYEGQTVPIRLKASYVVGTNDNGSYAGVFCPSIQGTASYNYVQSAVCATTTSNITAFNTASHPDNATFVANFHAWRPISAAIKVFYLGAEASSQGVIAVGHSDGLNPATANISTHFPTAIPDWLDLPGSFSQSVTSMTEPSVAIGRNFDRPTFQPIGTGQHLLTFPALWVVGTNLPVSAPSIIRIEAVINIEALPLHGNAITAHLQSVTSPDPLGMAMEHRRLAPVKTGVSSSVLRTPSPIKKGAPSHRPKRYKSMRRRHGPTATRGVAYLGAKYGFGGFVQPSKYKRKGAKRGGPYRGRVMGRTR